MHYRAENTARDAFVRSLAVEDYWQALVEVGWTEPLDATQTAQLRADVLHAFAIDPATAWPALAVFSFDAESIYEADGDGVSYPWIVRELATASNGRFAPDNIRCRLQDDRWQLSFSVGEATHTFTTRANSDYFDPLLLIVVNAALMGDEPFRFHTLAAVDQIVHIGFARPETVNLSVERRLIPPLS